MDVNASRPRTAPIPVVPAEASVLDSLRRIVRLLREGSSVAQRQVGVTAAQLFVLTRLRQESDLTMRDLAARTFTHQSTVSTVVAKLAKKGLVAIARDVSDRRQRRVSLTRDGRAMLRRAPELAQEELLTAVRTMPREVRESLAGSLRALVERLPDDGAPMFFEPPTGGGER